MSTSVMGPLENTGSSGTMIRVEHLVKMFGKLAAVDDVSFQVKKVEVFGLLGANGVGSYGIVTTAVAAPGFRRALTR